MREVKSFIYQHTRVVFTVFLVSFSGQANGQELLHAVRTEIENRGTSVNYTELYKLNDAFYFRQPSAGKQRIKFGDEIFEGFLDDTLVDFQRRDQFIFKLDTSLLVEDYYVIDNCDDFDDHTSTDTYSVMLVNMRNKEDADSLAIMTLPEGIQFKRSDYLGQSILLVTDHEFNYDRHLIPTTGKIIHIEGGKEDLYMVIEIPRGEPYILLETDTVYNRENPSGPQLSFVVASYNLGTDSFNWWGRCGSPWDDVVWELKLDSKENLIMVVKHYGDFEILGTHTESAGTDPDFNLVLKIDRDGNYVWSEVFEGATREFFFDLEVDEEDNIYLLGSISEVVTLFDTTIYSTNMTNSLSQGILLKLNPEGHFEWVCHLPGEYIQTQLWALSFGQNRKDLYLVGNLNGGALHLNSGDIVDDETHPAAFIVRLRQDTGLEIGHIAITQGVIASFRQIFNNANDNILVFLRLRGNVSFLGESLSPLQSKTSNFLLEISTPWDSIVAVRELNSGELDVFPNPVLSGQMITIETSDLNLSETMEFALVDQQGFTVRTIKGNSSNHISFSTRGIVPGCYNLVGFTKENYWTQQIIVQ